jgi:hypothetical protein
MAVVSSVLAGDGGTAVALDDGTVWLVYDGEWEELGGCDDGEVVALSASPGGIEIECGDGSAWTWSDGAGWMPLGDEIGAVPATGALRSWWPTLELSVRWRPTAYEGWVRLRWDL